VSFFNRSVSVPCAVYVSAHYLSCFPHNAAADCVHILLSLSGVYSCVVVMAFVLCCGHSFAANQVKLGNPRMTSWIQLRLGTDTLVVTMSSVDSNPLNFGFVAVCSMFVFLMQVGT
jgi:hypothetical protein